MWNRKSLVRSYFCRHIFGTVVIFLVDNAPARTAHRTTYRFKKKKKNSTGSFCHILLTARTSLRVIPSICSAIIILRRSAFLLLEIWSIFFFKSKVSDLNISNIFQRSGLEPWTQFHKPYIPVSICGQAVHKQIALHGFLQRHCVQKQRQITEPSNCQEFHKQLTM